MKEGFGGAYEILLEGPKRIEKNWVKFRNSAEQYRHPLTANFHRRRCARLRGIYTRRATDSVRLTIAFLPRKDYDSPKDPWLSVEGIDEHARRVDARFTSAEARLS